MVDLRAVASRGVAAAAVAGTAYLAFALLRVTAFARKRRQPSSGPRKGISILKPLHGLEPGLEENLASFCAQDYPNFEVLFSAVDGADPALAVARSVVERFPDVDARIVVAPATAAKNPKIANLTNAFAQAKHDVVAISDADMRVDPDYLRAVDAALAEPGAGAATALYSGVANGGAVATLSAMFVNEHFAPSVLVAQAVEPLAYCFGSTMAVSRAALEDIGGLPALGASIADDHTLGARMHATGRRVVLMPYVVANIMGDETLGAQWRRELRWARTIRAVRPLGSTLAVVTYGLPLAALAWLLRPRSPRRLVLLAAAVFLRVALHHAAGAAFTPRERPKAHLIPLRDGLAFAVWAVSRVGRQATWRGRDVTLD